MAVVAIIQARMGSTRLPGKVLMDVGGETVLGRVIHRLRRSRLIRRTVVATTISAADEAIVRVCQRLGVQAFRGSEDDVLDRYYCAAREHPGDAILRITSDCPLIDPELVDELIQVFQEQSADYASNVLTRTYPRGLDAEVFTAKALERAHGEARRPHEREHVTPYLYEHPELFRLASVHDESDYSQHRWTVDTLDDLQLIRQIYARFDDRSDFSWRDVLALLQREPDVAELNAHVLQKPVHGD